MKASVRFETVLKDHLADQEQAAKYLTACYEEGPEVFLQGLRDVVDAQGGMSRTAQHSYRIVSARLSKRHLQAKRPSASGRASAKFHRR